LGAVATVYSPPHLASMDSVDLNSIDASQKIWVGNLPAEATSEDLEAHFQQLGEPICCQVLPKGTGCVAYATADEAEAAITAYNGSEIGGALIKTDAWTMKPGKGAGGKAQGKGKRGMPPGGGKGKTGGKFGGKTDSKAGGKDPGMAFGQMYGGMMGGKGWGAPQMGGKGWGAPQAMHMGYAPQGMNPFIMQAMKPAAQKWGAAAPAPPTASLPAVHYISIDEGSALVQQGLPLEGPAAVFEKGIDLFGSSTHLLSDIVGDIATEVTITHDADWEQFPDIGEAIKEATGEEQCFAVATSAGTWAIGVANGWKGRESAAKLALALALASQNPESLGSLARTYPAFGALCRSQGFTVTPAASSQENGGKSTTTKQAALAPTAAAADVPPVHFLNVPGECKLVAAGLPADAPAIAHTKQLKEFFSNAHHILSELVEDISVAVTFEDDPDWKEVPEVGTALKEAGAEENGYCIAVCEEQACWGVGMASGWKARESAAKLALAMAIAQNTGRLEELAKTYSEFGVVLAAAGLVEQPQKRRRKGGW